MGNHNQFTRVIKIIGRNNNACPKRYKLCLLKMQSYMC